MENIEKDKTLEELSSEGAPEAELAPEETEAVEEAPEEAVEEVAEEAAEDAPAEEAAPEVLEAKKEEKKATLTKAMIPRADSLKAKDLN